MKKTLFAIAALAAIPAISFAWTIDPAQLDGLCGAELKQMVKNLYYPGKVVSYGEDTWEVFKTSDVIVIGNKMAWADMYSNRIVYLESGHPGMNIEHAVANSWWGGIKNDAYKDCYHLNPSDADANVKKSNNPLGEIEGLPTWTNGLSSIGRPTPATGGGASTVFEPADEYKGDFARAYFYVFTIYEGLDWQDAPACMYDLSAYPTLQPWAYEMLLKWAAADPVDDAEAARNRTISGWQENENPFITFPDLADHIWGAKKDQPFRVGYYNPIPNRPNAPTFGDYYLAGINTWTGRWWDAFDLQLSAPYGCEIYYSLSDEDGYQSYEDGISIPAAKKAGDTMVIKAYSTYLDGDAPRRSSIATLTLTAADDSKTDYMHAKWSKVTNLSEVSDEDLYIVVSSDVNAVMSTTAGSTSSSGYYSVSGNAEPTAEGLIEYVPEGTAVISLVKADGGQYYMQVNSLALEPQGFVSATAAKKMTLAEEGLPVEIAVNEDGTTSLSLGATYGTIQYNAQSPRFSVYTSKQKAVNLYRCVNTTSGVESVPAVNANDATRIFDLQGMEMKGDLNSLPAGLYIVVKDGKAIKIRK